MVGSEQLQGTHALAWGQVDRKEISKIVFGPNFFKIGLFGLGSEQSCCWSGNISENVLYPTGQDYQMKRYVLTWSQNLF